MTILLETFSRPKGLKNQQMIVKSRLINLLIAKKKEKGKFKIHFSLLVYLTRDLKPEASQKYPS